MGDDLSDPQNRKVKFVPDSPTEASHLNSRFFAASAPLGATSLTSELSLATGLEASTFDHNDLYREVVGSQEGQQEVGRRPQGSAFADVSQVTPYI